jgi:predicted nucleic acid-binding protein
LEKEGGYRIDSIIVDTGIIYSLADTEDSWHKHAVKFVTTFHGRLIVPSPVIAEACYLLNKNIGGEAEFIKSLINREVMIEHFDVNDLNRCVELFKQYKDINLGFVDTSLIAIAERLKICKILTTDRRHFSVIKPLHCQAFMLLP